MSNRLKRRETYSPSPTNIGRLPDGWLDSCRTDLITYGSGTAVASIDNANPIIGGTFEQGTASSQPIWTENAINGNPALYFDGTDYLSGPNSSTLGLISSDYEMFIVYKSKNNAIQFLTSVGGPGVVEHFENHTNTTYSRFIPTTLKYADKSGTTYNDNTCHIHQAAVISGTGYILVDGVSGGNVANAQDSTDASMTIGSRGDGNYKLTGYIGEVLIYGGDSLNVLQRNQILQYLRNKWQRPYTYDGESTIKSIP